MSVETTVFKIAVLYLGGSIFGNRENTIKKTADQNIWDCTGNI